MNENLRSASYILDLYTILTSSPVRTMKGKIISWIKSWYVGQFAQLAQYVLPMQSQTYVTKRLELILCGNYQHAID